MNVATWIGRNAATFPSHPALARGEAIHSDWETFAARVGAVAGALQHDLGAQPGDRAALVMTNSCEYLEALFGIWHAGLVAVPVNAKLHPEEVAWILDHSGATTVFTDEAHAGGIKTAAKIVAPGERWNEVRQHQPASLTDRKPEDPAWLFYTSGTTGRPKGATLTHRNLLMMSLSYFADIDPIEPNDAIIHAAPLSHGAGLYGLPHVARAATSVIPESGGVDAKEIAALLHRWNGVSFFAAPTIVGRLVAEPAIAQAPLEHLKTIIYGGAPMYRADLDRALDLFGLRLAQIYGQGESPMTITALSKAEHADENRRNTVGRARTDVEVKIFGDDDTELPIGEPGEVVVRGDVVMAGYWNDPAATAETLRNGWLHTGDVGSFDEHGYLTLRDRSKDVIISGGSNIYPREVEEILLRHPGVREVSVVGAPHPEWGEEVVAFVVGDAQTPPEPGELDRLCLHSIARFKRPKRYLFVPELPKNNYGKVLKRELRTQLLGSSAKADS